MQTPKPFVLNPDHHDAVEGKAAFSPLPKAQTGCLLLIFSGFLFLGVLLGFATISEWVVLEKFKNTGVNTQAQIIERYSGNFRGIKAYYLLLRFEDNGRSYENRAEVGVAQYNRYQVGDAAPIRFLPDDPTVVSVDWDGTTDTTFQRILTVSTIIFNVTVLALLVSMVAQYHKLLWLALGGEMLTGEITQASCCKDERDNHKVTIRYKFHAPTGKMLNGEASQTRNDLKQLPQRGTPVFVYFRDERTYIML